MRSLARIAAAAVLGLALLGPAAAETAFVDDGGRRVTLPAKVERVFPAGPPAAVILYMLAPEKMLGWTRAIAPAEKAFLAAPYGDLPELGRLTGRGGSVNLEVVVATRPDLVLDIGTTSGTYVSLADRVQAQTGVPTALVGGRLADAAATFRKVGEIIGARERAETLARYAETTLDEARRRIATVPAERRPRIYVARGPRGLETGIRGSINVEILDVLGLTNVAAEGLGSGGLVTVSPEQILAWQPDVILALDRSFARTVADDPIWRDVKAVRDGRVFLSPGLPFTWIDSPPSANRLIGIRWLGKVLFPDLFPEDLREETRRFYGLFYHREPSDAELDALLDGAATAH